MKYEFRTNGGATTIHECATDAEALLLLEPRVPNGRIAESVNQAKELANGPRIPNGGSLCRLVMIGGAVQRWQLRPPAHLMPAGGKTATQHNAEFGLRGDAAGWAHELDSKEATR